MSNPVSLRTKEPLRERLRASWHSGSISSHLMLLPAIFFLLICSTCRKQQCKKQQKNKNECPFSFHNV